MAHTIGAGVTMMIGGGVTEVMTALSCWRIPALLTYPKVPSSSSGGASSSSSSGGSEAGVHATAGLNAAADSSSGGEGDGSSKNAAGGEIDAAWTELNDAAKAAQAGDARV